MTRPSPVVQVMIDAALRAGRSLTRDFVRRDSLHVADKGDGDIVSAADERAEKVIHDYLSRMRPGYGFVLEEQGVIAGSDASHRFIVDPLDGTKNFMHGLAHFAVSIGLERDREPTAGVIFDVLRNDVYWAETGRGAWLDQRRQRVGSRRRIDEALIGAGGPDLKNHPTDDARLAGADGVRRSGSAALDLACVAAGSLDCYWSRGLKVWDMAAGVVLVREAGGNICGIENHDFLATGDLIAANRILCAKVRDVLTGAVRLSHR